MANLVPTDYPRGACELVRGFITGNEFYRNDDETLYPLGVAAGVPIVVKLTGPAVVDFNGDGALEIYSSAGHQSVSRQEPDG